jgi:hypothetical protein
MSEIDGAILATLEYTRRWYSWSEIAQNHAHDEGLVDFCREKAKAENDDFVEPVLPEVEAPPAKKAAAKKATAPST